MNTFVFKSTEHNIDKVNADVASHSPQVLPSWSKLCLSAGLTGFKLNASILQAQKDIGHFAKAIWVII
jgi:hypothetical protein